MTDPTPTPNTKPFRASPEQWEELERDAKFHPPLKFLLELRDRVQLLEAAQHVHISTTGLSDSQVKDLLESEPGRVQALEVPPDVDAPQTIHGIALKHVGTLRRIGILSEICSDLERAILEPMVVHPAEPGAGALPELDVPLALKRDWINRHGSVNEQGERIGTAWHMVINDAALWGQQQGWEAARADRPPAEPVIDRTELCRIWNEVESHDETSGDAMERLYRAGFQAGISAQTPPAEPTPSADSLDHLSDRAAVLWVLWHHQGGGSPIGQPLRRFLGLGQHERLGAASTQLAQRWHDSFVAGPASTEGTLPAEPAEPVPPPQPAPGTSEEDHVCWAAGHSHVAGPDFSGGLRAAVETAIDDAPGDGCGTWEPEARACLRTIAAWLRQRHGGSSTTADVLEAEADRP